MSESAEAKIPDISTVTEISKPNHALLARWVIREGKPFSRCAIEAGYSAGSAKRGLKGLMADSKPLTEAIRRETEAITIARLTDLKPLAVKRLQDEIANPKSVAGMKAIELAGRFKENDWFVRNADVQVGVMAVLGDSQAAESAKNSITSYIDVENDEKQE